MTVGRGPVTAASIAAVGVILWTAAVGLPACAFRSRSAGSDAPVVKTWVVPSREPRNCERYKTYDWPTEVKLSSEKACRLEEELRVFVTERQACTRKEECVVVPAACPFGCEGIPVAVSAAQAVKAKLEELRQRYDNYCRYKCDPVWRTTCQNGRCVAAR